MPRNSSGTYSLYTPGNPVVTNTVISSTWANNSLTDIATALTDSLSRTGDGGMTAPLELDNGTVGLPALTWTSEPTSGFYRHSAGSFRFAIGGVDVLTINSAGIYANPTGTVGLAAVNGTASTAMRSDAAPALSQAIAPTWTQAHIFSNGDGNLVLQNTSAGTNADNTLLRVNSLGTFAVSSALDASPSTASRNLLQGSRSANAWTDLTFGNATDNNTFTFAGTGACTHGGAVTITGTTTVNNQLTIGSSVAALVTNNASSQIYATNGSGSGDFAEAGNLMIQPRSSAARDIVLFTGTTSPTERLRIVRTGETRMAGQTQGPNGSASTPTYSFTGDVNTGFYTPSAASDDIYMSLGGTGYPVGYRGMPSRTTSGSDSTAATDNGRAITYTGSGGHTFTVDSDFGTAANIMVIINAGSATLAIAETLSGTMSLFNGSGSISTGSRTLAIGGVATIWMLDANNAYIWGIGLT